MDLNCLEAGLDHPQITPQEPPSTDEVLKLAPETAHSTAGDQQVQRSGSSRVLTAAVESEVECVIAQDPPQNEVDAEHWLVENSGQAEPHTSIAPEVAAVRAPNSKPLHCC